MRHSLLILATCMLAAILTLSAHAKPWKNITPLKTARAEVIAFLGDRIGVDDLGRALFDDEDGLVKVSWTHSDCSSDSLWSENEADHTALVYQITLEPKSRMSSIDQYEAPEKYDYGPKLSQSTKDDLRLAYGRWLDQDVNCFFGADSTGGCSIVNSRTGFGYSDSSKNGVTAIYYFPTKGERDDFEARLKPCAVDPPTSQGRLKSR